MKPSESTMAATAEVVETNVDRSSVPDYIFIAYHEAMIRDGRAAAIKVIEGRGYAVKDVEAAAQREYGETYQA